MTPKIMTVHGELDAASLDCVLAAETLLCAPRRRPGNAGLPATEAAFARTPVVIEHLGRLLAGDFNFDDGTLTASEAEASLHALTSAASAGGPETARIAVTALAGQNSTATPAALARLSASTGVAIVRGTNGRAEELRHDPDQHSRAARSETVPEDYSPEQIAAAIAAELTRDEFPAGIVGFVRLPSGAGAGTDTQPADSRTASLEAENLEAAAGAAREHGAALVLAPTGCLSRVEAGLIAIDRAGLDRSRVMITGAAALIGARQSNGRAGVGVDPERVARLEGLGTSICFDDLGRIPNTSTVVSDHDVAVTILGLGERGAGARVTVSSGIRNKHRLSTHGGNGLEFVPQQFLPYLRMMGASDVTLREIGGGNAARLLARRFPETEERN